MSATETNFSSNTETRIYNTNFWIAYVANLLLVTGNLMTFRFADWVVFLGGTNSLAGMLVSLGTLGAILSRLGLIHLIDRYGTRWQWMACTALYSLGVVGIMTSPDIGWQLRVSRVMYAIGVAGMFTCSVVHIQLGVPIHRRTEIIGMLGSSGFIGMMLGGVIGDFIYHSFPDDIKPETPFQSVFIVAALLGIIYLLLIWYLTQKDARPEHHEEQEVFKSLREYSPGFTLMIACLMGMGFAVNFVFLTRYATEHGLKMGAFYVLYAIAAFSFRIMTKNWNRLVGRHQMILRGLLAHILGQALLSVCIQEWQFLFPAIACGFGHALLFPAVVSLGSGAFPSTQRGIGTTLVMGFIDVGGLLFPPMLGYIIDVYGFTTMYIFSICSHILVALIYYLKYSRTVDVEQVTNTPQQLASNAAA